MSISSVHGTLCVVTRNDSSPAPVSFAECVFMV